MPGDVDKILRFGEGSLRHEKNPIGRHDEISSLPIFESCPELINIEVTEDSAKIVERGLSCSTGPLEIDSVSMSY